MEKVRIQGDFIRLDALLKFTALTGSGGGRLKELSDVCLRAPATVTADIQELHLPIYHTLCAMVEAHFFSE